MNQHPNIAVGILFAPEIAFVLNGPFHCNNTGDILSGSCRVIQQGNEIHIETEKETQKIQLPLELEPLDYADSCFELKNVVIGINFHWERKENQKFRGALKIIREEDHLTAINLLPLEDYLTSVISSEMSATSSPQLLRAHAIISRSWLLAQKEKERNLKQQRAPETIIEKENERIKWYDREDHMNFDVCADDHCQRYQGITRASTPEVEAAIADTYGQVLMYEGDICDARYSKCCGGVTEIFENVWESVNHPYLTKVVDNDVVPEGVDLELSNEKAAEKWIRGNSPAFCNTHDKSVLSQVLNDYDQETADFYRWRVKISQEQVQELLKKKIGLDVGEIKDLVPVERGVSGRLVKLRIEGTNGQMVIGKELEIRKALSDSHLYSSAFVVDKEPGTGNIPKSFTLTGAGWGHGVGLCQIGAAMMGDKGYSYREILAHYFREATLVLLYDFKQDKKK
jgi:stage II sporulation protein D